MADKNNCEFCKISDDTINQLKDGNGVKNNSKENTMSNPKINHKTYCVKIFLLRCPDFGYGFAKIIQHIRRICFIIFVSPRSKSEHLATKIFTQWVYGIFRRIKESLKITKLFYLMALFFSLPLFVFALIPPEETGGAGMMDWYFNSGMMGFMMNSGWMWIWMILGLVIAILLIVVLVALIIKLFQK